ncbi:polyribonucleotide nucleotidyltransferase [Pseudomonas xionganensis]|uniref:Polyribonucleotide nucleotidyltransferase n=1 Tax=Pseudomonas xionganensis TaxID=2654845 RepID=A0A6I4KYD8_9PSED|nr:polyribonucleotide nucleotidyltransferase [Pseudomonas xionganensis]MVW76751.1 polyribonucleotide nucleotidyltransferase [Pseudomonas xionganensis]
MHLHKRLVGGLLVATLTVQLSACGTLFYPDRRGQIEGRIDPAVAALNAVGVLFYVIPGLIAFAIDFATGAIYLPGGLNAQVDPQDLHNLADADGQIDPIKLKALILQQTGHNLPLDDLRLIRSSASAEQLAAHGLRPAA